MRNFTLEIPPEGYAARQLAPAQTDSKSQASAMSSGYAQAPAWQWEAWQRCPAK